MKIHWAEDVDPADFEAARRYLALVFPARDANVMRDRLQRARIERFAAKDILRASALKLLARSEPDVAKQVKKSDKGKPLSPLLLVRDDKRAHLIVADGFHRLCAVMSLDPNVDIPCKIA
jgi:hypothetical protein